LKQGINKVVKEAFVLSKQCKILG